MNRDSELVNDITSFLSLAWASFATCMGSAVTALNRYTKTIIEFKFKRTHIEKNLRIKQKLLELDLPEQLHVWDMYMPSGPELDVSGAEQSSPPPHLPSANGFKPPSGRSDLLDLDLSDEMEHPGEEEYC